MLSLRNAPCMTRRLNLKLPATAMRWEDLHRAGRAATPILAHLNEIFARLQEPSAWTRRAALAAIDQFGVPNKSDVGSA
jgi:hypothetical protein